jgi:hypothetical protein
MVVVAQLVRALDCGSRGRGFETHLPPQKVDSKESTFFVFYCYVLSSVVVAMYRELQTINGQSFFKSG